MGFVEHALCAMLPFSLHLVAVFFWYLVSSSSSLKPATILSAVTEHLYFDFSNSDLHTVSISNFLMSNKVVLQLDEPCPCAPLKNEPESSLSTIFKGVRFGATAIIKEMRIPAAVNIPPKTTM